MRRLKIMLLIVTLSFIGFSVMDVGTAHAQIPIQTADLHADACSGLDQIDSSNSCGSDGKGVTNVISSIVNLISYLIGVIAIIMIVIAGFRFITSGGDAGKVGAAKTALVYALVGLAVAALAQFLVHFVLNVAKTTPDPKTSSSQSSDSDQGNGDDKSDDNQIQTVP